MKVWGVLFAKECLELKRSFKWLWVPLVFLIVGISEPVTAYLMPNILKSAGGLPEGTILQIPVPTAGEAMASVLSNYSTIGLLVLVLAFMSTVSGERQRGITGLIMTKPVSRFAYLSSKWAAALMLSWGSLILGYAGAWYYTVLLLGKVDATSGLEALLVYGLWLSLVMTMTILMSSWLAGGAAAAAVTLLVTALLSIATSLLGRWMYWSPARLASHASELLLNAKPLRSFGISLTADIIAIGLLLVAAVLLFTKSSTHTE
ncbi:MAG: ABC transporter permease [Gorillibacterium sp.]|nr:ABC transporter permease [Gorillibacterium sp.]